MKNRKSIRFSLTTLTAAVVFLLAHENPALAASGTWNGSADATWVNASNWTTAVPGGLGTTNNADTATFSAASPSFGTISSPVIVDNTRNVQSITFDTTAASYVVGSTGGNALTLTTGGTIQNAATLTSGNTETINAPLILAGTAGVGTYTFANNSANLASALQIGGTVTGAASTAVTLTLGGTNTNTNNVLGGVLAAGTSGSLALNKTGTGYWDVTGNNSSYTGTTTISAGTLSMGNANALGSGTIALTGGSLAADTNVTLTNNFTNTAGGLTGFVSGSHSITTSGNYVFNSSLGTPSTFFNNLTNGATFSVTGNTYLANNTSSVGEVIFGGAGNTSLGQINGGPIGNSTIASQLYSFGTGTLTLNGTNSSTGPENFLGGTIVANESGAGAGSLLGTGSNVLTLGSTLKLSGGTLNQEAVGAYATAGSAQLSYQANITATPGSGNTISLGTIAVFGAGVSTTNFQPGVAFTTTASGVVGTPNLGNTGIFGSAAVAGYGLNSEDFATSLNNVGGTSAAIVGLPTYLYSSVGRNTAFTELIANESGTTGVDSGDGNFLNVKFDASNGTAAGGYNFTRTNALYNTDGANSGLLYTGFANFTVGGNAMVQNVATSSAVTGLIDVQQYGSGTLTINNNLYGTGTFTNAGVGSASPVNGNVASVTGGSVGNLVKSGPGTLILGGTNNYVGNTYINGGTLSISTDSNLGGISGSLTVTAATTTSTTVNVTGVPVYQTLVGASFLGTTVTSQSTSVGGVVTLTLAAAKSAAIGATPYANGQQLIELNGGTLQATANITLGETNGTVSNYRPITIGVNGGTIDVTGANTVIAPGVIAQTTGGTGQLGGDNGVASFTKTDSGTLVLAGANTYLGGTYINGGTLKLDFSANTVSNFTSPTSNILASGGTLTLGGGTLSINGAATAVANTQTIASLALSGGSNTISLTPNSAISVGLTFTNGAIARAAGSTIDFNPGTSTTVTLAGNNSNAFLGNYAFYGTGATEGYAATSSAGVVQLATQTAATGVNNFTSATANYTYASPGTPDNLTGNATANTAIFDTGSAQVIDLNGGTNTLTINGFINNGGALTIQRSSGTGTLAIGSSNELVIGGSTAVTISAPISGAGGLTDSNTGTLTLSGVNTYTGATTVDSGTLTISGGSLTGTNITTSGTGGGVVNETGGVIAGGGTFTQNSTGTSTLAGANTYTGLTTVSNGELDLNTTAGQSIAGNLTVSGGIAKLLQANQINTASSLAVSAGTFNLQTFNQSLSGVQLTGGTIASTTGVLSSSSAYDIQAGVASAILAGSGGLTKSTTGVALLTGVNTYTGTTAINGGTLYFSNISGLGASSSPIGLGGGTLYYSGSAGTLARSFGMTANSEIDSSATGTGLTISGNITGNTLTATFGGTGNTTLTGNITTTSGGVTNNAFGVVTLSGADTFTGLTTLNNGTLNVGSAFALGGGGNITFNGGTLQFSAANAVDYSNKIVNSTALGPISIDTNSQNVTFASNIGSTNLGGFTKLGAGTLTLSGTNTYAGTTTVSAGTLNVSSGSNLGSATTAISLGGGDFSYTGSSATFTRGFAQTAASEIDVTTPGQTLTLGTTNITGVFTTTFGGAGNITLTDLLATGAGFVVKNGTGTLTLTKANTYTGSTTVNGGALTLDFTATGAPTSNIMSATIPLTLGGGAFNINGATTGTTAQTLASLTIAAGANTISTINNGATSTGLTFTTGTPTRTGGTVDFVSPSGTSITLTGSTSAFLGDYAFFGTGTSETYAAAPSAVVQGATLTSAGTGANSFTTATSNYNYVSPGSTDTLTAARTANTAVFDTTGAQIIDLGASGANTLTLNGFLNTGGALTIQRTGGTGTLAVGTGNELVIGGSSNVTISAPISGAAALTDSNTGTLTLSGANTYTLGTTVNGGTLSFAATNNLGTATSAIALDGGLLSYTGATVSLGRGFTVSADGGEIDTTTSGNTLTVTTVVESGNGLTTFGGAGNTTAGVISGGGGVTKIGAGILTLSGTNTYTGSTMVSAGTLKVSGSTFSSSAVSVANAAALSGTGTVNGPVTVAGGGAINLTDSAIGTLHTGTLSIGQAGTPSSLTFEITSGSSSNLDSIAVNGSLVMTGTNGTTITIANIGSPTLSSGTYNLITYTGTESGTLSNLSLATTSLDGKTLSLVQGTGVIELNIGTSVSATTYNLATVAGSTLLHKGATTSLTTTITNTGGSSADTLNYTGLGASSSLGNGTGTATSGGPVANSGGTANNGQTYTATNAGSDTVSSTGSGTNATLGGSATLGTSSGTTINVYSGLSVWATNGSGSWGTVASGFGTNWGSTQGSPGLDAGFTTTDTATFGSAVTTGRSTVSLNGASPSLNAITFNDSSANYTLAQGSSGNVTLAASTGNATVTDTAGTDAIISVPVVLASNTTVNTASAQQMTFSGAVSGSGSFSTATGSGTTILSNATGNTYGGGTTVGAGKLYVNNTSNSGTGAGAVGVSAGATLGGSGIVSGAVTLATGATVGSGGTLSSGAIQSTAQTSLGGSGVDTVVGTGLTINSGLTINTGTTLSFALGAGGSGSIASPNTNSTWLNVTGSTAGEINFVKGTAITINIVDLTAFSTTDTLQLRSQTPYLLISAGADTDYANLYTTGGLDQNGYVLGVGTTMGSLVAFNFTQSDVTGGTLVSPYNNLQLYLNNGELEIVPEPGTWAMLLGGLAMLIFYQNRRKKFGRFL